MNLIPQNKINEASDRFAEQRMFDSSGYPPKVWFQSGVQFALNEIQPLMVEFLEWSAKHYVPIVGIEGLRYWLKGCYQNTENTYTTEHLLEEFINHKNNQKNEIN